MTVASEVYDIEYAGDGVTLAFAIPFNFLSNSDIEVSRRDSTGDSTVLSTGYAITGAGTGSGTCTFTTAPASGYTVRIERKPQILQSMDLVSNDSFPAETVEAAHDRAAYISQYLRALIARCIQVPSGDGSIGDLELAPVSTRASTILGFDSSGNLDYLTSIGSTVLSQAVIGGFLWPRTAAEIAASITPTSYAYEPGDVRRYGAVGDGSTDDTTALTNAFKPGHRVFSHRHLNHKMGQVIINGVNFELVTNGAKFTLNGSSAGFLVKGTVTYGRVWGGLYNGDGANRDGTPSTAQIAWTIGNESGAQVSNVHVIGAHFTNCNVGLKVADGRGGGGTKSKNCFAIGCVAYNMVGTVGGVGYGFQFAQADGSGLVNCVADTCGRHGIYFSEGKGYTASNIQARNCGFGSVRGAIVVSRSANTSLSGVLAESNNDVGLVIDTDSQGLAPDNVLNGVVVTGYEAYDNTLGDIRVGTSASPSTDGVPTNVTINGVTIRVKASSTNSAIVVQSCDGLVMKGLNIDASGAGASQRAIALSAVGGATYSKGITIEVDRIKTTGTGIAVQVESAIGSGSQYVNLAVRQLEGGGSEYEFVGGEDAVTNNNLFYRRANGASSRTYSSSGSLITVPVGGITSLTFSAGSATTVQTLSGGVEGSTLDLFFTNGNTTIKVTNIYLAGAVDFVGTANDCLRLIYKSGAWREVSRSFN